MKTYIIVISLIVIITLIIFSKVEKRLYLLKKQKAKKYLRESFGKTTSKNHVNLEAVQRDWTSISKNIPDNGKIDDITWFDLEMDQIYDEINNCQSFAGEQKLYSMLHTIGIPNIDFFRFMRILLFLSFIPAIATINHVYLWFPAFAALANIVIYSIQKNRYEAYPF